MAFSLWNAILLDWVNSTGFLVQNYENLSDTDIDAFYRAFVAQINSTNTQILNAQQFVKAKYPEFVLKCKDNEPISIGEYAYVYSLLLYYACVQKKDQNMQKICNNMIAKNQIAIAKFFECMEKNVKYTRVSIEEAMEEAENYDATSYQVSPVNRNIKTTLSSSSPHTPRSSKLLDSWNSQIRNLKAQLETERYERGFLEMQLKHLDEKFTKLDAENRTALIENNDLRKQVQQLTEDVATPQKNYKIDQAVKQLQRQLDEKEEELIKLTMDQNAAKEDNDLLSKQLTYSEIQVKSLNEKLLQLHDDVEDLKANIEQRDSTIDFVNKEKTDLEELVRELRSSSRKQDFDSSSSYDMLETSKDLNNSSFLIVNEENLANAVIDIRLMDQQKQNSALNESIARLQNELESLKSIETQCTVLSAEKDSLTTKITELVQTIDKQCHQLDTEKTARESIQSEYEATQSKYAEANKQIEALRSEKDGLNEQLKAAKAKIDETMSALQKIETQFATISAEMISLDTKVVELNGTIDEQSRQLNAEKTQLLEKQKQFDDIQSKLSSAENEKQSLEANLEKMKTEAANHQQQYQVVLNEQKKLITTHDESLQEIEMLKDSLTALKGEHKRLGESSVNKILHETMLAEREKKINDLEAVAAQVPDLETKVESLNVEIAKVIDLNNNFEQKVTDLTHEKDKLEKSNSGFAAELAKSNDQIQELKNTISTQNDQLTNAKSEYESVQKEFEATQSKYAEASQQIEMLQSEQNNLTEQLKMAQDEVKETANAMQVVEAQCAALSTEKSSLAAKIAELNCVIDEQGQQLNVIPEYEAKITSFSEEIAKVNKLNTELEQQIADLTQEKDKLYKSSYEYAAEAIKLNDKIQEMKNTVSSQSDQLSKERSERESIQKECDEVKSKHDEVSGQLETLQSEKVDLIEKLKAAEAKIDETVNALKSIEAQHTTLSIEKDSLVAKIAELGQTIDEQSQQLANEKMSNESIRSDYEVSQSKYAEAIRQTELLQTEKDGLAEQLKTAEAKINETSSAMQLIETQFTTISADKDSLASEIIKLTSTIEEQRQQLNVEQNHLQQNRNELSEIQEKVSSLELEKQSLQAEIDEIKAVAANRELALQTNLEEREKLTAKLVESSQQIEKLEDTISSLECENKLLVAEHEAKVSSLSEEIAKVNDQNNNFEQNINDLTQEKGSLVTEVAKSNEQIQELESTISTQNGQLANTKSECESIQKEYEATQSKYAEASRQIEALQSEKTDLTSKLETTQAKMIEIENALKSTETQYTALRTEKDSMATKIDELTRTIDEQNQQIGSEKMARESIQSEYEATQSKYAEANQQIEALRSEKGGLNEQLTAAKVKIDETMSTLQAIEKQFATVSAEKICLDTKIVELNERIDEQSRQLNAEKTQLLEKQKQFDEIQSKLSSAENEKQSLEASLAIHQQQYQVLLNEKEGLITKHGESLQEIEKLKGSLTAMEGELKQLGESSVNKILHETMLAEREKKINDLEAVAAQVPDLEMKVESLNVEIAKANDINNNFEQKVTDLTQEKDELSKWNNDFAGELAKANDQIQELRNTISTQNDQLTNMKSEYESVQKEFEAAQTKYAEISRQLDTLQSEKVDLAEKLKSAEVKADETAATLKSIETQYATTNTEKNSLVTKIIELNRTINEQSDQLNVEQNQLQVKQKEFDEIAEKLSSIETEKKLLEECLEKLKAEATKQQQEFESVSKEKEEIVAKRDEYSQELLNLKEQLTNLQKENKLLVDSSANKDEVTALKAQMEKNHQEQAEAWKKEKESLVQDVKIFRAKLIKEREKADEKEKEYKDTRHEYDEKLEKMKEKMKTLYKEEMSKVREKHEKELNDLTIQNQRYVEKIAQYEIRFEDFSKNLHSSNDERLQLLKQLEIMKSKLREYEIGSQLNGNAAVGSTSKFFDKIRGTNFKMEDEEGELFNNTYLEELKNGGPLTANGRESLTLEEIQRRNSMVPPHLRSSYMPQYLNPPKDTKANENIGSLDDSMFSTQSESRRNTLYKRPGPPTPSKNGGRFSFGGTNCELPRGEILRELSDNVQDGRPSLTVTTKATAAKKSTPGKFRSMFSSAKVKDEDSIRAKQYPKHLFISTSTPRNKQKIARPSTFESIASISLVENSLSVIDVNQFSLNWASLFQPLRRFSRKMLFAAEQRTAEPESSPEYGENHQNSTRVLSFKKSRDSRARPITKLGKKSLRSIRRERRFNVYDKTRKMSIIESRCIKSNATYDIVSIRSSTTLNESALEQAEIDNFNAEIKKCNSLNDLSIGQNASTELPDDNGNFEKFCSQKESQHPYIDVESPPNHSGSADNSSKDISYSVGKSLWQHTTPNSCISSGSKTLSASKRSRYGHSVRNQHKIPQIYKYKAEMHQSQTDFDILNFCQQLFVGIVTSARAKVIGEWDRTPISVQVYLIAITICFISILINQVM